MKPGFTTSNPNLSSNLLKSARKNTLKRSESALSAGKIVIEDFWGEKGVVQTLHVGQQ
jgi:hypothetical protein